MPNLSGLLRKLEALHRQQHDLAREVADVERQIVAAGADHKPRARSTKAELIALVREVVQVLRTAGQPLPRAEIASATGTSLETDSYDCYVDLDGDGKGDDLDGDGKPDTRKFTTKDLVNCGIAAAGAYYGMLIPQSASQCLKALGLI